MELTGAHLLSIPKALCAAHPLLGPHAQGQERKRAAETESLGSVLRVMDRELYIHRQHRRGSDPDHSLHAGVHERLFCMLSCLPKRQLSYPLWNIRNLPSRFPGEIVCGLPGQDRAPPCHTKSSHYLAPPSPGDHFSFPHTPIVETLHPFWLDLKA